MDRLLSMEAFVRVVDAGSFAEAARRWGRSKAVVSKNVAQLEEHLGTRLLQRTTRYVGLTEAGRVHLDACRQVLSGLEEAEDRLRMEHTAPSGLLRITAPPGFLSVYRRTVLAGFLERYPAVSLEIDLSPAFVDLVDARMDVAIRLTEPEDSSLVARRLGPAPLVLVASPGWVARHGAPDRPEDLSGLPCLCDTNFRFHPRWPFLVDGRRVQVAVSGPVRVNSPLLVGDLVRDGLGVGLLPRMLVAEDLERGDLVELLPGTVDTSWSIYAVTSQRRLLPARARAFIEHLRRSLA